MTKTEARPYLEAAEREGRFGVVMIGVAQERTRAFRTFRGYRGKRPLASFDYCDRHFGPAFIKLSSYCRSPFGSG